MPVTPDYRKYVETHLARICPLRSKAMFGGVGLYSGDLLFGIIDNDRLYFKVDDVNRPHYEKEGMGPWEVAPGQINDNYREVPKHILENDVLVADWVNAAVSVVERKNKGKKKVTGIGPLS